MRTKWKFLLSAVLAAGLMSAAMGQEPIGPMLQRISVNITCPSAGGGTQGSGTIVLAEVGGKPTTWILTAHHVVQGLREVKDVIGSDGEQKKQVRYKDAQIIQEQVQDGRAVGEQKYDAKVISVDPKRDIALLRVRIDKFTDMGAKFYLDPIIPPPGTRLYHCLLPDTQVQGDFYAGYRSFYDGEAVEIITKSGAKLRVTQNHPVLTKHGFVAAGSLEQGDKLFHRVGKTEVAGHRATIRLCDSGAAPQVNDSPSTVEEVFKSLTRTGRSESRRIVAGDFHGDGQSIKGDVHTVWANRDLLLNSEAPLAKGACDYVLKGINMASPASAMTCGGQASARFGAKRCPDSRGRLCGISGSESGVSQMVLNSSPANAISTNKRLDSHAPFVVGQHLGFLGHTNPLVSGIANRDSPLPEVLDDSGTRDSRCFCHGTERHSGPIETDEIVNIHRFHWSGHVYDLSARDGLIIANSLVVSNCGAPGGKEIGGTCSLTGGLVSRIGVRIPDFGGGSEHGVFDQTDTAALGGSSGGLIALQEDGRWIGMITLGLQGGDSFHWTVPVRSVRDWAKQVGAEWLLDPALPRPTDADIEKIPLELDPPGFKSAAANQPTPAPTVTTMERDDSAEEKLRHE